jgi:hypothetical protein
MVAATAPRGVRRVHEDGDPAVTLCTVIADLTAGAAIFAGRDQQPVTSPLRDLAEGRPDRQRPFRSPQPYADEQLEPAPR